MSSLAEIATELYAGPRAEFVSARNARAKEIDDPTLAAQVRALRKPTIAAWVMNVFATERVDQLGQALQLAEELREAQEDLDSSAMRELSSQRRVLTNTLAKQAAELATARGERVTEATLDAVRQTLTAAFFHQDAAAAVASGRLVRELGPAGDDPLPEVLAGGAPSPGVPQQADELRPRRERRKAEKRVRSAEQELERATREQEKVDREWKDAEERVHRLTTHVADLQADLERAQNQERTARTRLEEKADRQTAATECVTTAQRELDEARAALEAHG